MSSAAARDIKKALYRHFSRRYAVLTELGIATGDKWPAPAYRNVDVLLYQPADRIAIEVKVSKPDLLKDVADPSKQLTWSRVTHRLAFAVPDYLEAVALEHVPTNYGVLRIRRWEDRFPEVTWVRRAKKTEPESDLPLNVLMNIASRCAEHEANEKGYGWAPQENEIPPKAAAEIRRLKHDIELLDKRLEAATDKRNEYRKMLQKAAPLPCKFCGQPLKPHWHRNYVDRWEHQEPGQDDRCRELNADAARWGAFYPDLEAAP